MSTILSSLANQAIFSDASTQDIYNSSLGSGGGAGDGLYNVIGQGLRHQHSVGGRLPTDAPSHFSSSSSSPDTPSLENLAPELNDESINRLKFVVLGCLGCVLVVLGFMGNTLSMVVLQQRQMRSSTSYYLLSLAIYDNLILVSMLLYFIIPALAINIPFMGEYLATYAITEPIGYPLSLTAQMGSIYTCVGFTVERFIAVCRPLQVANTCTKSRTIRAIVLIFVWSVLYNIPRYFYLHAVHVYHEPDSPLEGSGPEIGAQGTTVGLMTALTTSSVLQGTNGHFQFHQNASSSSSVFLSSYPLSFNPSATTANPCRTKGGEHSLLSSSSYSSSTSSVDSFFNGLNLPCIYKDNIIDKNNDLRSSSPFPSLSPPYSQSSQSSPSPSIIWLLKPSASSSPKSSSTIAPVDPAFPTQSSSPTTTQTSKQTVSPERVLKYVKARPTEFGSDPVFRNIYLIYSHMFFMFLLPFLLILFMNIGLIRAVKRSKVMQQRMGTSASARKERNLTVMLIAVIVVFLVCQFPTIIDNILIAVFGGSVLYPNYQYQCFYTACTLMVLINSASNFLLYCFFGKKFRVVLLSLLGIKKRQQYVAYRSTMYRSRSNGSRACDIEMSVV